MDGTADPPTHLHVVAGAADGPAGHAVAHLVRAIASIPPYVTLPGITAARASLNLHIALVGPSSSGKSSSVAVAKAGTGGDAGTSYDESGSGEGIAKHYAYRDTKTKEIVTETDTLLFVDTEIESVEALAKRSSSPLMSQWRKTFTGERLGFGYADLEEPYPGARPQVPVLPDPRHTARIGGMAAYRYAGCGRHATTHSLGTRLSTPKCHLLRTYRNGRGRWCYRRGRSHRSRLMTASRRATTAR